jgi:two-component system nitrate/nitrite response regulator NarL
MSTQKRAPSAGIRVAFVDADSMGCQLMASALKRCRDRFEVLGLSSSSEEAIHLMGAHKPHVVVLGVALEDGPRAGLQVLEKMRESYPRIAPVMLLPALDRETVVQSFRAGARGVISRRDSFKALAKCIRTVHEGQVWASTKEINYLLEALGQSKSLQFQNSTGLSQLTAREREVTLLLAEGMTNRDIALALHVTEHTVSNYLYRIFDRLGVSSRVQLILYALSHNQSGSPRPQESNWDEAGSKKSA